MYGKVDEKVDVYAYGILLLELITGKEATRTNQASNQESLLLWVTILEFEPLILSPPQFLSFSLILIIAGKISADKRPIRTPY